MPLRDWLAALVVITAWGLNFVVIKIGLSEFPPLLMGALRFTLVAIPAVFFIKPPALPWRTVVLYGATISLGQFVFLFAAIYVGMPAGLASVVLQSQAFFTTLIAAVFLGERIRRHNVVGLLVAALGLVLIQQGAVAGTLSLTGFLMTLAAGLSWAIGNIVTKGVGKIDMLSLVVWGALVPPLPFLGLSLVFEGPALIMTSLQNATWVGVSMLAYLVVFATLLGYCLWGWLLSRHPAGQVAPLTLAVPVLGLLSTSLLLNEQLVFWQWVGGVVILVALAINSFGARVFR
jgi:O-acetylserine/cysteine efflux transporter